MEAAPTATMVIVEDEAAIAAALVARLRAEGHEFGTHGADPQR